MANTDPPPDAIYAVVLLRERELAQRWKTTTRTLQRWRAENFGPPYLRIGGSVRYRLIDILDYEERQRCQFGGVK